AGLGPSLDRVYDSVLRKLRRQADNTGHARDPCDDLGRLDAPHRVDGAVGIGRRHRLASFCAMRALTSFRTSLAGRGWSAVKRMVPLAVWYDASSCLRVFGRWVLMKRLR